jgi:hypothetical protein
MERGPNRERYHLTTFIEIMCQSYPEIETDRPPAAQLAVAGWTKTGRTVLLFVFILLFASLGANAQNAATGDETKVLWQNPAPELSQNAKRSLLAAQLGGLDSAGYMLVIVKLEAGKATEVRTLMSSGALTADKEICQFVLDHWVFNPKAAGVYKFPVLLPRGL